MPRFDDYLTEVQQRNGFAPAIALIRAWAPQEIARVEAAFRTAAIESRIVGSQIPNFNGTNQSKGNKAADFFLSTVPQHLAAPNSIEVVAEFRTSC